MAIDIAAPYWTPVYAADGGRIVADGSPDELMADKRSGTGPWLRPRRAPAKPSRSRRKAKQRTQESNA